MVVMQVVQGVEIAKAVKRVQNKAAHELAKRTMQTASLAKACSSVHCPNGWKRS